MTRTFILIATIALSTCRHTEPHQSSLNSPAENCGEQISNNECDFYQCLEQGYKCGSNGYPLGYGSRYCAAFQNFCKNTLTSSSAKMWVQGTTKCLQSIIYSQQEHLNSCQDIDTAGFESHSYCYTSGAVAYGGVSFCTLSTQEWFDVRGCISSIDLVSLRGLRQILTTAIKCSSIYQGTSLDESKPQEKLDPQTQQYINSLNSSEKQQRVNDLMQFISETESMLNHSENNL